MKPTASTPETRRRDVIARAVSGRDDPKMHATYREAAAVVVALGPDATAAEVNAIRPVFWKVDATATCHGCEQPAERVVTVGEELDYESRTARLCRPCLVAALAALDAAA